MLADRATEKRRCSFVTRPGEPCPVLAMHDSDPPACPAHGGKLRGDPHVAARASGRKRHERAMERRKSVVDRMAEALEEKADAIVTAYLAAGLEQGDWRALEALVSRVHGRPVEKVETQSVAEVKELSLTELRQLRARLLQQYPELRAVE